MRRSETHRARAWSQHNGSDGNQVQRLLGNLFSCSLQINSPAAADGAASGLDQTELEHPVSLLCWETDTAAVVSPYSDQDVLTCHFLFGFSQQYCPHD